MNKFRTQTRMDSELLSNLFRVISWSKLPFREMTGNPANQMQCFSLEDITLAQAKNNKGKISDKSYGLEERVRIENL